MAYTYYVTYSYVHIYLTESTMMHMNGDTSCATIIIHATGNKQSCVKHIFKGVAMF